MHKILYKVKGYKFFNLKRRWNITWADSPLYHWIVIFLPRLWGSNKVVNFIIVLIFSIEKKKQQQQQYRKLFTLVSILPGCRLLWAATRDSFYIHLIVRISTLQTNDCVHSHSFAPKPWQQTTKSLFQNKPVLLLPGGSHWVFQQK